MSDSYLQRGGGNAAAGANDQYRLARLEIGMRDQHTPRRNKHQRKGGGFLERKSARNGKAVLCRHADEFRIGAVIALSQKAPLTAQRLLFSGAELDIRRTRKSGKDKPRRRV